MVRVAGGGPAGCAAALAAMREGADAVLYEKCRTARHKVCGEFISPEALPVLDSLGVSIDVLRPTRIRRFELQVGMFGRTVRLPEPALGLSRYALDKFLLNRVPSVRRETAESADVIATGRAKGPPQAESLPHRDRLFGFKAHYTGPQADSIGLYFFGRAYVGVNSVEAGMTNVCGIAPESLLRKRRFDFDALVHSYRPLSERLQKLSRAWKWIAAGPLRFERRYEGLRCGDALGFIDPFTGSGILHALWTGRLAGIAAARGTPAAEYAAQCQRALRRPFAAAALIRSAIEHHWSALALFAPVRLLYRATRIQA